MDPRDLITKDMTVRSIRKAHRRSPNTEGVTFDTKRGPIPNIKQRRKEQFPLGEATANNNTDPSAPVNVGSFRRKQNGSDLQLQATVVGIKPGASRDQRPKKQKAYDRKKLTNERYSIIPPPNNMYGIQR